MKCLLIDTSQPHCLIAIAMDETFVDEFHFGAKKQGEVIIPMIHKLLSMAELTLKDLDAIAVVQGPGAFTGLRVGIGVAQGLAMGSGLPLLGISSLQAYAQSAYHAGIGEQVAVAIDAKMGEAYRGDYIVERDGVMHLAGEERLCPVGELSADCSPSFVKAGDGWGDCSPNSNNVATISARGLTTLAEFVFKKGKLIAPELIKPVYIRNNVIQN